MNKLRIPNYLSLNVLAVQKKEQNLTKIVSAFYSIDNAEVKSVLALFEHNDKKIKREDVIFLFETNQIVKGVYAAMIWGGMSTSPAMGNHFGKLLEVPVERLCEIVDKVTKLLRNGEVKLAYDYMEADGKIPGMGHAFFTKIFFFVSMAQKFTVIAPIYDKWTKLAHCALLYDSDNEHLAKKYFAKRTNDIVNLRACASDAYEDYVQKMGLWATALKVSVCQLETFIFGNHKSIDKSDDNPRFQFPRMLKAINQ